MFGYSSIVSLVVIMVVQVQAQQGQNKCSPSSCVIISSCPAFLKLVIQMKSGNHAARRKVISSQCGFEKSLPKVCCPGLVAKTEKPKTTTQPPAFEPKPAPVALVQTAKHSGINIRRIIKPKVTLPHNCGITTVFSTRIVSGSQTDVNAWPWVAALGYREQLTGKIFYLCGASLITNKHLVTAAHCLRDDLVTVRLGEHTIGDDDDGANPEEFKILKTTKHKQFRKSTFTNDIAIVELEKEVPFKHGIQPVCLPSHTPRLMRESFVSESAHVAGWGRTSWRGSRSKELLEAILKVFSNRECREKFAGFPDVDIADSKLCAGDKNDIGACLGDSGGPLVTLEKADDNRYRYHLIGVVSSGYSKCHTIKGFPDVYTRVTYFDQWIRDNIR